MGGGGEEETRTTKKIQMIMTTMTAQRDLPTA